jgi:hypothetical protein
MPGSGTPNGYRFSASTRLLAALAYLGIASGIILGINLRSRFIWRHAVIATGLHVIRVIWCAVALILWTVRGGQPHDIGRLSLDLATLFVAGVPWPRGLDQTLALALALPLGFTWILAVVAAVLAATGRSVDLKAMVSADWSDSGFVGFSIFQSQPLGALTGNESTRSHVDDRMRARELTEQRLDRMWNASRVAAIERRRSERMEQVRGDLDLILSQLGNLNRMLSLGEISLSRFNVVHTELIDYLKALRAELSDLELRRADLQSLPARSPRPATLDALPEVRVLTLAIVDRGGIPIQTYGYFTLDESIITGMVSAFESLTAEMFGSQVHKTQLADGQVVYFARGQASVTFAIFEDDPAPQQISKLREFVDEFERANTLVLESLPIDSARLQPVEMPFSFAPAASEEPTPVTAHQTAQPVTTLKRIH